MVYTKAKSIPVDVDADLESVSPARVRSKMSKYRHPAAKTTSSKNLPFGRLAKVDHEMPVIEENEQ